MTEAASIPGWYGKIPYLGDFASRRLPQTFIAPWDAWLQQSIAASRNQLGPRWLEVYLHSPIWRFALMPGVISESLWAGMVMPSVDKVGRHFPLTIAAEIAPRPGALVALMAAREWHVGLETAALATLNTEYPVEQFETSLGALALPEAIYSEAVHEAARLAGWWRQPGGHFAQALSAGYTVHHLVCAAGSQLFETAGAGKSLWWQESDAPAAPRLACYNGLPPADGYAALLQSHPVTEATALA